MGDVVMSIPIGVLREGLYGVVCVPKIDGVGTRVTSGIGEYHAVPGPKPHMSLCCPTYRENSHANHTWHHRSHQTTCFKGSEAPSLWVRFPSPAPFFVVWVSLRCPGARLSFPPSSHSLDAATGGFLKQPSEIDNHGFNDFHSVLASLGLEVRLVCAWI